MRDTERTLRARALLIWNLHTYHFKSIPLRIVHRAIIILSSGGGTRSSSHRARAGEEALLPSSIERLVEESKTKMDTDGGREKVSAQPGSLPPMSAAAGGGAFATINVSPFLW